MERRPVRFPAMTRFKTIRNTAVKASHASLISKAHQVAEVIDTAGHVSSIREGARPTPVGATLSARCRENGCIVSAPSSPPHSHRAGRG